MTSKARHYMAVLPPQSVSKNHRDRFRPHLGLDHENVRVLLLLLLTSVTGSVDAASYLGLGQVFTANMTGNVAIIGFAAGGAALPLLGSAIALGAFIVGTIIAGRIVRRSDLSSTWPLQLAICVGVSFAMLLSVFLVWVTQPRAPSPHVIAPLLAFAMGIQGAATRRLSVADLPTTVVTSTLTSLGADSRLAGGTSVRWRRRAAAVAALLLGALAGAGLFHIREAFALVPGLAALAIVIIVSRLLPDRKLGPAQDFRSGRS
ncbi:YoaK family protein [Planotetraspora phitsanulokensis]|uniref:Membrane protein n=1 Tax=Planotetraspora phitsanulokensis TaxID=575192 RepID=A0A8J3U096_9ACTN|nr:YoaK family protein [Planotetraspora phitsanulokensis]GII35861.1 membrane protein [Planotetraspora phitsanulokensis]